MNTFSLKTSANSREKVKLYSRGSPYCPGKLYCIIRVVSLRPREMLKVLLAGIWWRGGEALKIFYLWSGLCRVYYTISWCDTDPNDNILPTASSSGTTYSILGMCHVRPLTLLTSFTYLCPPPLPPRNPLTFKNNKVLCYKDFIKTFKDFFQSRQS